MSSYGIKNNMVRMVLLAAAFAAAATINHRPSTENNHSVQDEASRKVKNTTDDAMDKWPACQTSEEQQDGSPAATVIRFPRE
jgi:hypothetical protein